MGDLSGKFGWMKPTITGPANKHILKFYGSILDDPNPPLSINYLKADQRSSGWTTLVLSCPIRPKGISYEPLLLSANFIASVNASAVTPALPIGLVTNFRGKFNASILKEQARGAQGSFAIDIDDEGRGTYNYFIDLRSFRFPPNCPKETVLTYGLQCKFYC